MQFIAPYFLIGDTKEIAVSLHPDHLADLRISGLTDETARAAGVYSIRPCDIAEFFGRKGPPNDLTSALCFPYQGRAFARIKLFPKIGKRKYSQPPRTGARIYMPFSIGSNRLYVCEGEKKTLAAHQAGLNAVGIGGIWNWLAQGQPIDDLVAVSWDGRDVSIVGDSDVWQRTDLLRALYALGVQIAELGAHVDFLEIPSGGNGKIGLDDYFVLGRKIDSLVVHGIGSNVMARFRLWHQNWRMNKALAMQVQESKEIDAREKVGSEKGLDPNDEWDI